MFYGKASVLLARFMMKEDPLQSPYKMTSLLPISLPPKPRQKSKFKNLHHASRLCPSDPTAKVAGVCLLSTGNNGETPEIINMLNKDSLLKVEVGGLVC